MPTFLTIILDPGIIVAATIVKAAEDISPGTTILRLLKLFPPVIKTLFFPEVFDLYAFYYFALIMSSFMY